MNEYRAFIAAMAARPDDTFLPLVFADYLDEHGQCERAEVIRAGTGGIQRRVECDWEWYLKNAAEVAYHDPIAEWVITDREPLHHRAGGCSWWEIGNRSTRVWTAFHEPSCVKAVYGRLKGREGSIWKAYPSILRRDGRLSGRVCAGCE